MLSGSADFVGCVIGLEVWEPIARAPKDGGPVMLRRKSGRLHMARWSKLFGRWVNVLYFPILARKDDPITGFRYVY